MSTVSPSLSAFALASHWLEITPENAVRVFSGKVELGQGISGALTQVVCDELGIQSHCIHVTSGDTSLTPDEGYTAGSQSVEVGVAAIRWACAAVRTHYAQFASKCFECSVSDLSIINGVFQYAQHQLNYYEISKQLALRTIRLDDFDLKILDITRPINKPIQRPDLERKLTGAGFVHDLVLPSLWHARVLRGPHPQCKPLQFDRKALESIDGVDQVYIKNDFIALLGKHEEPLIKAHAKALGMINWSKPRIPKYQETQELLSLLAVQSSTAYDQTFFKPDPVDDPGVQSLTKRYTRPYLSHASIGLCCALAQFTNGQLTVWSHSQGVFKLKDEICKALELNSGQLRVIHSHGSGCYGHNGADDVAFDAALLAFELGINVRVLWSREDELTQSPMGPASLVQLSAEVTNQGKIRNWHAQVWSHTHLNRPGFGEGIQLLGAWAAIGEHVQPIPRDVPLPSGGGLRNIITPYTVSSLKIDHHFIKDSPVRVSALRSLGAHANVFAIESFMDELADSLALDPLEFRLMNLQDARAIGVLQKVAKMCDWSNRGEPGQSIGQGIGFSQYKNHAGYCAVVVRVELTHKVQVQKVWACVDAGRIVHKDGLINQVEGGIIQSLSWTLKESVRWNENGIITNSWESYEIIGFDEIPQIEIELIEAPSQPSLGAGEVAAGPTAAALANALSHALRVRVRDMPLSIENITKSINEYS